VTYASSPVTYDQWFAVSPTAPSTTGGSPTTFSVFPALPAGLSLDPTTGTVSGTPTSTSPSKDYVVTASNSDGSAQGTLTLAVDGSATSLAPKAGPFTDADVRHFMARTQFGGNEATRQAIVAAGIPAFVDGMLAFTTDAALEAEAAGEIADQNFPLAQELARWWLHLMVRTSNPFQEELAFFWHDHFASSSSVLDGSELRFMRTQIDLWRTQGNANLRDLLVAMSRDWAMLEFLDGVRNSKFAPNENFAREFYELFTLGVDDGYTQADVVEAARAWTGYRLRFDVPTGSNLTVVEFDPTRHDATSKTIFGHVIAGQNLHDDFADVVDATLAARPVAEFVCKKLFEWFAYVSPPTVLVDAMATDLRNGGYALTPFLAKLFKSQAFFSARARDGLVKGPVHHAIGFIRETGLRIRYSNLDNRLTATGQRPTQPPTVNGWPSGDLWLSAQGMLDRANLVEACIADRANQAAAGIDPADLLPPGTPTSSETVDALAALLRVTLSPADHTACVTYLDTHRQNDGTVVPSPFDPTNPQHVDERVRGLLYVLANHPTYQIR
jgi:uncharacterized protein (DUF1800 family)